MADVRGAQYFTFSVMEAVEVLLDSLRARGVAIKPVERANIMIDQATNTVQLLIINPIVAGEEGKQTKFN